MKNLVVQVFFDKKLMSNGFTPSWNVKYRGELSQNNNPLVYEWSQILAKRYANRIGADYILFDKPVVDFYNPTMERFRLMEEDYWADTYENILYLDSDTFVYDDCPDLFKLYPQETLRACWDPWRMLPSLETKIVKEFGKNIMSRYFNAGVLLFHKDILRQIKPHLKFRERFEEFPHSDQSELNYIVMKENIPITFMDQCYNSRVPDETARISHLTGANKYIRHPYQVNKARRIVGHHE